MAREGKLFSNTLLLGATSVLSKAVSFLLLPLYTGALSPAAFGIVDILVSTAVLLIPVISLHAPEAVFRFRVEGEPGVFWAGVTFVGVGLSLLALGMPLFALSKLFAPYMGLLYAYVTASILRSFFAHLLRADGAFSLYALQQLFCAALTTVLQILFLVVLQWGIEGYLLAVILGDGVTFAILLLFLPTHWKDSSPNLPLCKRMLRYALPLVPTAALWWAISASDRYVLLAFHGEAATGIYAAAGRLPALVSLSVSVFLEAWHYAALRCEKKAQGGLFGRIYALLVPTLILGGVLLSIGAGWGVRFLLAPEYGEAALLVPLLVFGAVCGGLSNFVDSIYSLRYASGASLLTSFLATLANVLLNFLLIPSLAGLGAALATALSFAGLLGLRLWHTRRYLSFQRLALPLGCSLVLFLSASVCYGVGRGGLGMLFALLCPLPLAREICAAAIFLCKRGRAFLHYVEKKKKCPKKF